MANRRSNSDGQNYAMTRWVSVVLFISIFVPRIATAQILQPVPPEIEYEAVVCDSGQLCLDLEAPAGYVKILSDPAHLSIGLSPLSGSSAVVQLTQTQRTVVSSTRSADGERCRLLLSLPLLTPGFYRIDLRVDVRDISFLALENVVYVSPARGSPSGVEIGDQFLVTNANDSLPAGTLPDDMVRIVREQSQKAAWLAEDERTGRTMVLSDGAAPNAVSVKSLVRIGSDPGVEEARRLLLGKSIWPLGFVPVSCVLPSGMIVSGALSRSAPTRVSAAARMLGTAEPSALGLLYDREGDMRKTGYIALDPLILRVSTARADPILGASVFQVNPPPGSFPPSQDVTEAFQSIATKGLQACASAVVTLTDAWEVARVFADTSPLREPSTSKAFAEAIVSGKIQIGMTRRMAVAAVGYPSSHESIEEMLHDDTWVYENGRFPDGFFVTFQNNRVTSVQGGGSLP